MLRKEKIALTFIGKNLVFNSVMKKITLGDWLEYDEKTYILACAILFMQHYEKDNRYTSYADISYYIILKYSLNQNDYEPLFDFCMNFGFYPVAKSILEQGFLKAYDIDNCLRDIQLDKFSNNNYTETLEQYIQRRRFLESSSFERSYLAPTSFGKSALIVDDIKSNDINNTKIVIVVPTKSLLMQTYEMIRRANLNIKIIIHDEMYNNEDSIIAIFTQERALRFLRRADVYFDTIFIDEAHNLLKVDPRWILLSRLIVKNRERNNNQRIIYLSPLVENANNLKVDDSQEISSHMITFNIKEPEIYEYREDGNAFKYNRFVNQFYPLDSQSSIFDYLNLNSGNKNFLYNYRPIKIEQLAHDLCETLPENEASDLITEIEEVLRKEVHDDFYAINYLRYGVIYLHGKLPDLIKEYLEHKFKTLPELKYIIANSVILEGMNLPIDTLFVFNTRSLSGKELMNLIGRVNRLNTIFSSDSGHLNSLLPDVHFLNNKEHNGKTGNMHGKIELLRSRVFLDSVENPTLQSFDINKLDSNKRNNENFINKIDLIKENEIFIRTNPEDDGDKIKLYLVESGINDFYSDTAPLVASIIDKIEEVGGEDCNLTSWGEMPMMDKIEYLFIDNIDAVLIVDFEIDRLRHQKTRKYYENFILLSRRKSLKENVVSQFEYFNIKKESENKKLYVGSAYGEESYDNESFGKNVYVDLNKKNDAELINLAVVKIKMEEDFVSFKLNKLIVMMHDFNLISDDEYNSYIYGTTDQNKINLSKYGLSVSLITRLENKDQLKNISFDQFNNLKGNVEFDAFMSSIDDFFRFELNRHLV